jgi:hypothetical protein
MIVASDGGRLPEDGSFLLLPVSLFSFAHETNSKGVLKWRSNLKFLQVLVNNTTAITNAGGVVLLAKAAAAGRAQPAIRARHRAAAHRMIGAFPTSWL